MICVRFTADRPLRGCKERSRRPGNGDENAAVMTLSQYSEITARKYYEADEIESTMCAGFWPRTSVTQGHISAYINAV